MGAHMSWSSAPTSGGPAEGALEGCMGSGIPSELPPAKALFSWQLPVSPPSGGRSRAGWAEAAVSGKLWGFPYVTQGMLTSFDPPTGGHQKTAASRTSLAAQWLRLCASTAAGEGSIPSRGAKIPHVVRTKNLKNF